MSALQRFEQRLETLISGVFARAFRSAVQPVEIAAALQRECDNNAQVLSRQRKLVPNEFHVELSTTDLDRLQPFDTALESELTTQLHEHAEAQGYVFPGPVAIHFSDAGDLTTGRFRIRSTAKAQVTGDASHTRLTRAHAVLEVNGTRHPLDSTIVVGRGSEADLRINDPGVSRRHVEFRVSGTGPIPRIEIHDLGSTNGMLVDGQRMQSSLAKDGTEVKIGRTALVVRVIEEPQP
ncbi:FhaA domain-containing protein [Nocardioides sp. Kera G14]|uniref:FhaA domain-containing protein n=1 Tax=Nocardioides sp. Kera G14 TaxID=2884264 RepID=UPI001D1153DF|nr:DUF3662 and FHA domain-containing protein [Nocardioides sp. Kera G14]UDY23634.1 FHA domain-containing protein [Nocardioides sp. Kera G14]